MNNNRQYQQCRICKYAVVKVKLFGKEKLTCTLQNRTVTGEGCSKFVSDGNKMLKEFGFRKHGFQDGNFGNQEGCYSCSYQELIHDPDGGVSYACKKNGIHFRQGVSPLYYTCDNYKDGGEESIIDYLAYATLCVDRTGPEKSKAGR